jgi:NTP pyrophosphatase (non-canonical NTP hydrolase)
MTEPKTIAGLTEMMHSFVRAKGWYETDSKRQQTPRNLAASLAIEAAEVLEHYQWEDRPVDKTEVAGELADVMLYLLQLASVEDIDLEQAILSTLTKNHARDWDGENQ